MNRVKDFLTNINNKMHIVYSRVNQKNLSDCSKYNFKIVKKERKKKRL